MTVNILKRLFHSEPSIPCADDRRRAEDRRKAREAERVRLQAAMERFNRAASRVKQARKQEQGEPDD